MKNKQNGVRACSKVCWSTMFLKSLSFHLLISGSILGLTKEKPLNAFWSMVSMSFLSPCERRGFSFRNSRSKLLQSLGDFCRQKIRVQLASKHLKILRIHAGVSKHIGARADVRGSYHFRLERRLNLSLGQCCPVDDFKEGVQTNVAHHTQPFAGVSHKQLKKSQETFTTEKQPKVSVILRGCP